jgi:HTH-type transcriptional repressor of NAD biosynthesis genes
MEKRYKSAYVLMKAMPFHNGHKLLCDTAIHNSDKLTIVIGSLPTEPIPGSIRFKWVQEEYRNNPNVTVKHCDVVLPQFPEEDPVNFWDIWVDVAKSYCPDDLDVIFSSENYGITYADKLCIEHYMVDIDRKIIPVSGTMCREDPFAMWDYLPDQVKPYFVKRIAIMGSESCGKSTLTKWLAKKYKTNYVEEYGRTVYEEQNHGNINTFSRFHFLDIMQGRQIIENAMIKQSNKLLFCDTEDLTTVLFYDMYFPDDMNQLCGDIRNKLRDTLSSKPKYDFYILLKPDCDAVQDGTRNFLDQRWNHYNKLKSEMTNMGYDFVEVGGSWINHFIKASDAIKNKFGW